MRILAFYICLVFFFLGEGNIFAQAVDSTVIVDADTLGETEKKAGFGSLFAGKPGRAFLYSAILPGAGQAYNRKYWKVPIVYAALGTTVYVLIDNINEFNRFDDAYRSRIDNDTMPIDEFADILTLSGINNFRQQWRKNVQRTYITLGLLYLIQASEAFVDRHLMDFNVDDDLSLRVRVKAHSNLVGLTCQFVKPPPPEPKSFFD